MADMTLVSSPKAKIRNATHAFRRGAKRGLKIVVGTVPVFIVAGFIEGYITRHTEMALSIRLGIIALSLVFVVGYYIVLPHYLYSNKQ